MTEIYLEGFFNLLINRDYGEGFKMRKNIQIKSLLMLGWVADYGANFLKGVK